MRANPSQSDANLMSIRCQSSANRVPLKRQYITNPMQSRFQLTNPMPNLSIIRQFIANPRPIRESTTNKQPITNPPIQCRSVSANPPPIHHCQSANHMPIRQSLTNPSIPHHFRNIIPIHCQSPNQMPICRSNANLPIHHQSDNPRPIGQPDEKSSYPPTIHDQSADTAANLNPSVDPMPILD